MRRQEGHFTAIDCVEDESWAVSSSSKLAKKRYWLQAPHGRYWGRRPTEEWIEHDRHDELRNQLAVRVRGLTEVGLVCGRADVAGTHRWYTGIYEVEPYETWRRGLQQILAYAYETGLRPHLALYGSSHGYESVYRKLEDQLGGRVWLWVYRHRWETVGNRAAARKIVA